MPLSYHFSKQKKKPLKKKRRPSPVGQERQRSVGRAIGASKNRDGPRVEEDPVAVLAVSPPVADRRPDEANQSDKRKEHNCFPHGDLLGRGVTVMFSIAQIPIPVDGYFWLT